jgi:NHLM bacteriocin system ABC transporter peptidase/ATP-binding protein
MRTRFSKQRLTYAPRVKTPTILQIEATECGAAALAIVLAHHGRVVPLEQLRIACGVSRDGSKASNLVKAARSYGLKAKGFAKQPDGLPALSLPQIVFWNFNHFLVVEGFGPDRVYLNDPATGPRVVSAEEFDQSFTGVVLIFEPGPDFQKGGARPSLPAALRGRLAGSGAGLAFVVLATLALIIPGLAIPTFARVFVDQVLIGGMTNWLGPLLIGMALTAALRAALTWLQLSYLLRLETRLALGAAGRFFWHVLHLPVEFFAQRYAGEISARVAINDRVARLLSGELATTVLSLVLLVFYALLMFQYDLLLTLIGIGIALLNIAALRAIARRRGDSNRRLQYDRGKLLGTAYAGLEMIETLKATGAESDFFARWAGYHAKVVNAEQRLAVFSQVLAVVPALLSALNTAAILVVGGLRIMDGRLTVGMLVAFQSLMASFLQPVNQLVTLGGTLQEVEANINRLDDVLRYPCDPQAERDAADAPGPGAQLSGLVELRNVTFGYSRMDPPLLEDLNLTLKPGARVALVGGSGSGKSTVAKLVAGLYAPWSGEILFDGRPCNELPRSVLVRSLAMVDQDIALFAGTVRENLTLWDASISEQALLRAARDAAIDAEIVARPGGYGSPIEEGGRDLSGGQRQRLEIARALTRDPTILVLDEATSALDPLTEQIIDGNLRRRGCACLIVAHRLSTIRDADEILVLERGKLVQRGAHDELIATPGPYASLIQVSAPEVPAG